MKDQLYIDPDDQPSVQWTVWVARAWLFVFCTIITAGLYGIYKLLCWWIGG